MCLTVNEDFGRMKPIIEWLQELPEPHRSRAIRACVNPDRKVDNLMDAIYGMCYWWMTKERFEYWDKICYGDYDNADNYLPENYQP